MTIPTLMNKTKDAEFNAGIKHAFSEFSQALTMISQQNSGIDISSLSSLELANNFCSVLSCLNIGDKTAGLKMFGTTAYKSYKSSSASWSVDSSDTGTQSYFALKNGELLQIWTYSGGKVLADSQIAHGGFIIDINGPKGPNMWGFDLHRFWIISKNTDFYILLPTGYNNSADGYSCVKGDTSTNQDVSKGCTTLRLYSPGNMP